MGHSQPGWGTQDAPQKCLGNTGATQSFRVLFSAIELGVCLLEVASVHPPIYLSAGMAGAGRSLSSVLSAELPRFSPVARGGRCKSVFFVCELSLKFLNAKWS